MTTAIKIHETSAPTKNLVEGDIFSYGLFRRAYVLSCDGHAYALGANACPPVLSPSYVEEVKARSDFRIANKADLHF